MKKVLYYISDHNLGHITRSVAVIRELLKEGIEVTVRNSNVAYLNKSLPQIQTIPGVTDVGSASKNDGVSIDEKKTLEEVGKWLESIPHVANKEYELMSKIKPNLIISDISAMPFLSSHRAHINSVAISNFLWMDVIRGLTSKQVALLEEAYKLADIVIQLPLGPQMKPFLNKKRVGLVCKKPTQSRKAIRENLGLKESDICVFINLDKYFKIKTRTENNIKIISTGARIDSNNVKYIEPWIEGQDLINASDLVICKCGYGMISECLTNGIPFLYILDDNHLEQKAIYDELISRGLQNRITENDFNDLILDREYISQIKIRREKNETEVAASILREFIK